MKKGFIHLYTGNGGGKTTSALGVAMRSVGQGHRVVAVQFMKGRTDIGEYKIQKLLGKLYEVFQFGRKEFVDLKKPSKKDEELAYVALGFAKKVMIEKKHPQLLILDEINLAAAIGLVNIKDVVKMLKKAPRGIDIYLTGRHAPKEFMAVSDYVTSVEDKKRVKLISARRGIDY